MDAAASCSKIVDNGDDAKRFILAITGDGFNSSQLDTFHDAVATLLSGLKGIVPISWRLQDAINLYQVDTVAPSGYVLGTSGSGSNLSADPAKVSSALAAANITWHLAVVIANTSSAGGSFGASQCTVTLDSGNVGLLAQAIAQLVAGLGVEYATLELDFPDMEPASPNLTAVDVSTTPPKWAQYLTPGFATLPSNPSASGWQSWMVGAFEGGGNYATKIYRPSQNCLMRDPAADFCIVCYNELLKAFAPYHQTTGLSWLASQDVRGNWAAVRAVSAPVQPSPIQALSTISLSNRLYVFTLTNGVVGRNSATVTGQWESLHPVPMDTSALGVVSDIATTLNGAVLHLAALSGNQVWLAGLPGGTTWSAFAAIPSKGLPNGCKRLACAVIGSQLFVFAAGTAGVWMSVRTGPTNWDANWTEVTPQLGLGAGSAIDCIAAGAAAQGTLVHLFAAQGSTLKHVKVTPTRTWLGLENVSSTGLTPALDLNCAIRDETSVFLAAATSKGPFGATRNAAAWPATASSLSALPATVSRVSAGLVSGTLLAAAS